MEDALARHSAQAYTPTATSVLILVLMEDALALIVLLPFIAVGVGLNPCFNGRCTRTRVSALHNSRPRVLIRVLIEDALAPRKEQT